MKRLLYSIQVAIALIIATSVSAQKVNYPNTLLWRISGKNLQAPSYLYGTMHLQDKRLFDFGDSLYAAIEGAEGLAIEIDFKEYIDSMFRYGLEKGRDEMLAEQKVKIDKTKLDKSLDTIFRKLHIDKSNLTKKDLKKIRDYRTSKLLQNGEMPTIVDGYLFGLALRQGKWAGGIEDVEDQMNIDDEIGGELTPESVFVSDKLMRQGLEQMVQIYLKQDLEALEAYCSNYDSTARDALLIKRNIKMARRMDSLTGIRTMFFAVGAAHLPGDSGVISVLRNRGFTVEPVFSSKKIAASQYAEKLKSIPWYKVEDDNKMYTVEMPGNPSKFDEYGQAMQMKMYFDISTMTFYMAGQTIGTTSGGKGFDEMFKQMAKKMGAEKQTQVKNVSSNGIEAREAVFENEGVSFKVRLLQREKSLFLLMAGSMNAKGLASDDVAHFFQSFVALKVSTEEKPLVQFKVPEKAFSLKLPAEAKRNKAFDKTSEGTMWDFTTYDLADNTNGLYYLIQVRDIKEGYYLENDSLYFESYLQDVKTRMDTVSDVKYTHYKGFPAMQADMLFNKSFRYKVLLVIRGSRVYLTMVGGAADQALAQAQTLFESLAFEDYLPSTWTKHAKAGFSTLSPVPFSELRIDTANIMQQFTAHNVNDAVTYHVFKEPLKPYYWINSDSAFFAEKESIYVNEQDSVLSKNFVYNGAHKALDLLIRKDGLNNLQKLRLLTNGDTLYTLTALIPVQYIGDKQHNQFFENFAIEKEIPPTIFRSKAKEMLEALKSTDSTEFANAAATFKAMVFVKEDLPFLHGLVKEDFLDAGEYDNVQEKALEHIISFNDQSTLTFVEKNYGELDGEKERLKYQLLVLLAEHKSSESYHLLAKLLSQSPPKAGEVYELANAMLDSFELVKNIYPTLLQLSTDSIFSDAVAKISWQLLDSGMINMNVMQQYKGVFIQQAGKKFAAAKASGEDDDWWYYHWIKLMQALNDADGNKLLQQLTKANSVDMQYEAVIALLVNGQTVSPAALNKLAADKYFRLELFSYLQSSKKLALFPTAFKNQKSIAESEIFQLASDDDEPSKIEFVGERITTFLGNRTKFYLFKVHYSYEEGDEAYLGITGPYDLQAKEITVSGKVSGLTSEVWNVKQLEQQFKKHVKEMEEYYISQAQEQ